jgi:single-stranded-DNA-specific exonuclease
VTSRLKWIQREPKEKYRKKDDLITKLAKIRGVSNIDSFLNPSSEDLHSPFLLENIEDACNIIIKAIYQRKKICVSVDPDSDGLFSTSIMVRFLRQFTDNVYYTYHQRSMGHGIENQIQYIQEDTDLLIILDSSTNSVDACKEISEKGIEIVILDHHAVEVDNPYALIVNPQKDKYPNKEISGAGVTFKAIQVMDETLQSDTVFNFIDLCGMGMYADMMSVSVPENRFIIIEAMKNIHNTGLKCILKSKSIDEESVNSQTIGFIISPLINGVARLERIELALDLLMSDDEMECMLIVKEMMDLNEKRKEKEKELVDQYLPQVNTEDKVIVVTDTNASKGFNGLVATKLSQEFQRPTIVLRDHKGSLSGSFRTYGDFKMKTFLRNSKLVNSAEGHEQAGGIIMYKRQLDFLKEYMNDTLKNVVFESNIEYDLEIDSDDISFDLIKEVDKFNLLTGQGFPAIKFKVKNILVDERVIMGKQKNVLKIKCDGLNLMKFKVKEDYAENVEDMDTLEVIGQLNINEWYNWGKRQTITEKQVFIDDYLIVNR